MDQRLTTLQGPHELDKALSDSHVRPLLLFKHSYTCGVSAEALDELRAHIDDAGATQAGAIQADAIRVDTVPAGAVQVGAVQYAMVTVQTHRELSNRIAERLGVRHETPQAILVREGRAVWSASHFRVNVAEIQKALASDPSDNEAIG